MDRFEEPVVSRRRLLVVGLVLGVPAVLAACSSGGSERTTRTPRTTSGSTSGSPTTLAPTPACGDGDPTEAQTEGPFYEPDSPEKADFTGDVSNGTRIVLTGSVLTTTCQPVGGALLDVWHADADGEYDNEGYRLRGHFFTDDQGAYRFTQLPAGEYVVSFALQGFQTLNIEGGQSYELSFELAASHATKRTPSSLLRSSWTSATALRARTPPSPSSSSHRLG